MPFSHLILLLLQAGKGSLQREVDKFFDFFASDITFTASALTQARKKLRPSAFSHLNKHLLSHVYSSVSSGSGIQRIFAIDGTTLALPDTPEIAKKYGRAKNNNDAKRPLATVSALFDVVNKLIVDISINPAYTSENHLAMKHLEHIRKGDLLILDRAYRCLWLMLAIQERKADFLIRLSASSFPEVREFLSSNSRDATVTISPSSWIKERSAEVGIEPRPLTARLVKVLLSSGETEILLTTLSSKDRYPLIIFQRLYFMRWGIEEAFKTVKSTLDVERFSGKTSRAVKQDFYAAILLHNMQALMTKESEVNKKIKKKTKKRKLEYQVNKTTVLFYLKRRLLDLMFGEELENTIKHIRQKITRDILSIREKRSYKRKINDRRVAKSTMVKGVSP